MKAFETAANETAEIASEAIIRNNNTQAVMNTSTLSGALKSQSSKEKAAEKNQRKSAVRFADQIEVTDEEAERASL